MSYLSYDRRVREHVVSLESKYCFEDLGKSVEAAIRDVVSDQLDTSTVEVEVKLMNGRSSLVITIKTAAQVH